MSRSKLSTEDWSEVEALLLVKEPSHRGGIRGGRGIRMVLWLSAGAALLFGGAAYFYSLPAGRTCATCLTDTAKVTAPERLAADAPKMVVAPRETSVSEGRSAADATTSPDARPAIPAGGDAAATRSVAALDQPADTAADDTAPASPVTHRHRHHHHHRSPR